MSYSENIASPELFRKWTAIGAIAGALERRCWIKTNRGVLFPNLFVMLVAAPSIGKSEAIKLAERLWTQTGRLAVAPRSLTKAALVDALKEAEQTLTLPGAKEEYHSLIIPASELGVFLPAHDLEFLSVLNDLYDNPDVFRERRRHFNQGKDLEIIRPQLNILSGSQPGFLAHLLPEEAWTMGFTSRMIMVYQAKHAEDKPLFGGDIFDLKPEETRLAGRLRGMTEKNGEFSLTPEAIAVIEAWRLARWMPEPEHGKLVSYNGRRPIYFLKLCMVSAISRDGSRLQVTVEDVQRAREWMLEVEALMPDIFREMVQRSDADVLDELHHFMWTEYVRKKQEPLHISSLWNFLKTRVPSEKIERIIQTATNSRVMEKIPLSEHWKPLPRHQHGME